MKEKLKKEDTGFAQIKNEVLRNPKISLKVKGLFALLYSYPDDWDFSADRIAGDCLEERKAIQNTLRELERAGHLTRKKLSNGKVEYFVSYTAKVPKGDLGSEAKRLGGETGLIKNKEVLTNTELETNKEEALAKKSQKFIDNLKVAMQGVSVNKSQIEELKKFVSYWTEPTKSRTRIRWELQKTWDMKRRIGTWFRNSDQFGRFKKENNKYKAGKI